nr:hypothetical protein CFP56_50425 [Quercus suber]
MLRRNERPQHSKSAPPHPTTRSGNRDRQFICKQTASAIRVLTGAYALSKMLKHWPRKSKEGLFCWFSCLRFVTSAGTVYIIPDCGGAAGARSMLIHCSYTVAQLLATNVLRREHDMHQGFNLQISFYG